MDRNLFTHINGYLKIEPRIWKCSKNLFCSAGLKNIETIGRQKLKPSKIVRPAFSRFHLRNLRRFRFNTWKTSPAHLLLQTGLKLRLKHEWPWFDISFEIFLQEYSLLTYLSKPSLHVHSYFESNCLLHLVVNLSHSEKNKKALIWTCRSQRR